ncbi:MAG: DUF262 domain-containing HNH endonuclease family protein [Acutalibacteraceae bacterium]|nr:DUF262 domain-containing HNH endonuclease family protein [Acutalibacteraceae bacterium]
MANELQPLSLLFQNRLFRIPDYQRGYAWQQQQLVDFWEDIINLQDDRYHYTGLLSLKPLKHNETTTWGSDLWMTEANYKPCHIVDGQQRLTTFVILLNEIVLFIRALPENKGNSDREIVLGVETLETVIAKYIYQKRAPHNQITTYLFGYETDNPSAEYLRYRIFEEPFSGSVSETYYTKNLKAAKEFFIDNLNELYKTEGLTGINRLYKKLTQKLMFNIHEIDDDYDVFVAFETMNNRGKKLTNLELLKNRLIYLTTLYDDKKFDSLEKTHLRKEINEAWKEVYYQLGRNKDTPLSDDEFLRAHWIIYFTYTRNWGDDYIRYLLNKFSAKNIFEKQTIFSAESETISVPVDDYEDVIVTDEPEPIIISKLEPIEISNYVNSLKNLASYWYYTFFPYDTDAHNPLTQEEKLWIERLNRIGIGYFRPLVAAILSRSDISTPDERIASFKAIERFIFICFRIGMFNATYSNVDFYNAARNMYLNKDSLTALTNKINAKADSDTEYAVNAFIAKNEKRFSKGTGYYGWNSKYYFMYEYEYSLYTTQGVKKLSWDMFTKSEKIKVTIEHILPQTPSKYYWRNLYRQFSAEEITQLSCALGNLLPLSQSVNSSLQNDSFDDKKNPKVEGRRGYTDGSHSEIEVSKESDWTAKHIYNRSIKLLRFMEKRWNIILTEEQLKKLVFVTFVNDDRKIPEELKE